jgi:hypothetical protein
MVVSSSTNVVCRPSGLDTPSDLVGGYGFAVVPTPPYYINSMVLDLLLSKKLNPRRQPSPSDYRCLFPYVSYCAFRLPGLNILLLLSAGRLKAVICFISIVPIMSLCPCRLGCGLLRFRKHGIQKFIYAFSSPFCLHLA